MRPVRVRSAAVARPRRVWVRIAVLALLVAVAAPNALAQRQQRGAFELWGGLAGDSPQWGLLGQAPDVSLGLIALRWTRAIGAPAPAGELPALEWVLDIIPVARLSPSLISLRGTGQPCETAVLCVLRPVDVSSSRFPPGSPFGVGVAPLGITRRFNRTSQVSPFVGVNGGMLWFDRAVPTTKASHFNFTASAELGVRFGPPDEPGITVSYRFHHISNAGTAGENPGVASHLFTLGVHRPRFLRGTP